VLVLGAHLEEAFDRLEHLEHVAHVTCLVHAMDRVAPLTEEQLAQLIVQARKRGIRLPQGAGATTTDDEKESF
jgi:ribulose-5-phosphate 4-epimerase/fuculose-1-phosphate aldolase